MFVDPHLIHPLAKPPNQHPEVHGNERYKLPPQLYLEEDDDSAEGGVWHYCSPWCGGGCLKAEHDHAVDRARNLCLDLGLGWRPRVWENLGWHWSAERGPIEVHPVIHWDCGKMALTGYTAIANTAGGINVTSSTYKAVDALDGALTQIARKIMATDAQIRDAAGDGMWKHHLSAAARWVEEGGICR